IPHSRGTEALFPDQFSAAGRRAPGVPRTRAGADGRHHPLRIHQENEHGKRPGAGRHRTEKPGRLRAACGPDEGAGRVLQRNQPGFHAVPLPGVAHDPPVKRLVLQALEQFFAGAEIRLDDPRMAFAVEADVEADDAEAAAAPAEPAGRPQAEPVDAAFQPAEPSAAVRTAVRAGVREAAGAGTVRTGVMAADGFAEDAADVGPAKG